MSKRTWDGCFSESKYIETGNMVGDIIENGGRLLHEPTTDGYTHEVVDRGNYITDDYYFPQKEPGKKLHVHYELRSNGEVLIDGKSIVVDTKGGMTMKELRKRGTLDSHREMREKAEDLAGRSEELHRLGMKFEFEKAEFEKRLEAVENSRIAEEDKRKLISAIETAIELLQEQYYCDVEVIEKQIEEDLASEIEEMQDASDELEKEAADLRGVKTEAATTDVSAAADAADEKKEAFDRLKEEYVERLNLRIEQANIQQQNIWIRRLTGR